MSGSGSGGSKGLTHAEAASRARRDAQGRHSDGKSVGEVLQSKLPMEVKSQDGLRVLAWGSVPHAAYCTELRLWPVGYKVEWQHPRTKDLFVCEVLDGGPAAPRFRITGPDGAEVASSANASLAWVALEKTFPGGGSNVARWVEAVESGAHAASENRDGPNAATAARLSDWWGHERLGMNDWRVRRLLEAVEGTQHCQAYRFLESRGDLSEERKRTEKLCDRHVI
eukprot:CAMPEP_0182852446 /NCGR_PEP_ID=MMETSP0034_2-20130328/168_1 /TAXON_ID=156128 /ORGANISM="Nephroselmis pyriformis, Strain CCMP717" /LENGTH=224 /DNA_ID=CAMNT_0024983155 /DNA_START=151 /DNA_END=822 /DNA_ORIENTATION=+